MHFVVEVTFEAKSGQPLPPVACITILKDNNKSGVLAQIKPKYLGPFIRWAREVGGRIDLRMHDGEDVYLLDVKNIDGTIHSGTV